MNKLLFVILSFLSIYGCSSSGTEKKDKANNISGDTPKTEGPMKAGAVDSLSTSFDDFSVGTVIGAFYPSESFKLTTFIVSNVRFTEEEFINAECLKKSEEPDGTKSLLIPMNSNQAGYIDDSGFPLKKNYTIPEKISDNAAIGAQFLKFEGGKPSATILHGDVVFLKQPTAKDNNFEMEVNLRDGSEFLKGKFRGKLVTPKECDSDTVIPGGSEGSGESNYNVADFEFDHSCPTDSESTEAPITACMELWKKKGSTVDINACGEDRVKSTTPCSKPGPKFAVCRPKTVVTNFFMNLVYNYSLENEGLTKSVLEAACKDGIVESN